MWRLGFSGLAERWTLFTGAALSVCLGVALVQSSLLLLISAATYDPPAGLSAAARMGYQDSTEAAVAMLGITLGFAAFLAVFIISSTFGFTVAQRRRDLALLRLVGGSRGQVRRMLLGEAVLLGAFGAALGVPAGLAMMALQSGLLRTLDFVPPDFTGQWRDWILGVSGGTAVLLAVSGVLVAARRAARVRPLEALRDTGESARVMTAGRWIAGLFFLAGATTLIILSPVGGVAGGPALSSNVPLCAAVAAAAFAPLLVPAVARILPVWSGGAVGELARANLRDGRRRSASVAAPVIVLVALVLGQAGASGSFTTAAVEQLRASTRADLVVEATGPLPRVAGVAVASTETDLPIRMVTGTGEETEAEIGSALVVDPAAYALVHPGSPATLQPGTVAAGPGGGPAVGTGVGVRLADGDLGTLPVTAKVPAALGGGGANLLLPPGVVPAGVLAGAPSRTYVQLAPGADRAAVAAALAKNGTVSDVDDRLARQAAAQSDISNKILLVVLGLGALYALIGVVNSVVIAAAARRREFAEARVTGLTRGQVIRAALLESSLVTAAGLMLGGLAAGLAFIAVLATTMKVTGSATLDMPWRVVAGLAVTAFAVTGVTSLITSWSATRGRPVSLLGARE
jgi:putative ABC transport system permease protein